MHKIAHTNTCGLKREVLHIIVMMKMILNLDLKHCTWNKVKIFKDSVPRKLPVDFLHIAHTCMSHVLSFHEQIFHRIKYLYITFSSHSSFLSLHLPAPSMTRTIKIFWKSTNWIHLGRHHTSALNTWITEIILCPVNADYVEKRLNFLSFNLSQLSLSYHLRK